MTKIENQFVIVNGEKIFVDKEGYLDLTREKITDMDEIIGLENIEGLKVQFKSRIVNFEDFMIKLIKIIKNERYR